MSILYAQQNQLCMFDDIRKDDFQLNEYVEVGDVLPKQKFFSIELFAGAGGMALGMELAGFENILNVEIDKDACDTLRTNRPNWLVVEKANELGRAFINSYYCTRYETDRKMPSRRD